MGLAIFTPFLLIAVALAPLVGIPLFLVLIAGMTLLAKACLNQLQLQGETAR